MKIPTVGQHTTSIRTVSVEWLSCVTNSGWLHLLNTTGGFVSLVTGAVVILQALALRLSSSMKELKRLSSQPWFAMHCCTTSSWPGSSAACSILSVWSGNNRSVTYSKMAIMQLWRKLNKESERCKAVTTGLWVRGKNRIFTHSYSYAVQPQSQYNRVVLWSSCTEWSWIWHNT